MPFVACHEHGTALSGFCQLHGTTWVASYGTSLRPAGGAAMSSLTRRVMFVDAEGVKGGFQGDQRG